VPAVRAVAGLMIKAAEFKAGAAGFQGSSGNSA